MSAKSFKKHLLLLFLIPFINLADLVLGNPTTIVRDEKIIESVEEINDFLKNDSMLRDSPSGKLNEPVFTHHDEDMLADLKQSTILASLKSDVEILESNEDENEDVEIEERFKRPAITLNTDNFINENIEVNADLEKSVNKDSLASSHLILGIVLAVVVILALGLYVALVVWRRQIEQRYGMRELLVSNDNQDYWPQDVIASVVAQHQQQYEYQQQLRS